METETERETAFHHNTATVRMTVNASEKQFLNNFTFQKAYSIKQSEKNDTRWYCVGLQLDDRNLSY